MGRHSSAATYIDSPTAPYTSSATYDANGRLATQTYPTGFAVKYLYTGKGYLKEVLRNDTSAQLWKANTVSAEGQLLQFQHGNGVVTNQTFYATTGRLNTTTAGTGNTVQNMTYAYDGLSNLTSRQDGNFAQLENFQYDGLNRLNAWQIQGTGSTGVISKTVTYNAIGNILTKSDVLGTYTYNASGPTSVRPHAIASLMNGTTTVTSFTYDANGNLLSGDGRTLTYKSFDIPATITQGTNTLTFTFDTEHQRVKEISPSDTKILVMADVHYEKEVPTSGPTKHNHYLYAYGVPVALHVTRSDATSNTRYFHLDHLGSIRVISNEAGGVLERLSYDPWGKRRQPNGNDDTAGTLVGINTDRGFTQHEHLDEVGLIHMNGRVYDPRIGRFLQADPIVQNPFSLQSLNRYSYVLNNPLGFTDPSGYESEIIFSSTNAGGSVTTGTTTGPDIVLSSTRTKSATPSSQDTAGCVFR